MLTDNKINEEMAKDMLQEFKDMMLQEGRSPLQRLNDYRVVSIWEQQLLQCEDIGTRMVAYSVQSLRIKLELAIAKEMN